MAPRYLAIGIVVSLVLHAAAAAVLLLLPPPDGPDAGGASIVPLRLLAPRPPAPPAPPPPSMATPPSRFADDSPPAPAGGLGSTRAARPPRPPQPDRNAPPEGAEPALAGEARLPAAAVASVPSNSQPNDGDTAPGHAGTVADGPQQAGGVGAGGARTGVAGAPQSSEAGLDRLRVAYALDVRRSLESIGRYPTVARRLGLAGRVVLRVRIDDAGRVANSSVETPSDHPELDDAALASTRRLHALAPPPGGAIDVVVPVVFTMRSR